MNQALMQRSSKPVAIWLMIGVGMFVVQILLGGVTRLTGSGLSITQWNVVTGALPPLNEHQWLTEFEKYRQTPQYHLLNFDFTLRNFKFIFFWEWFHRLWARLIALAFLIPFFIFLFQNRIRGKMVLPLVILFLLGALQGAVGWIMVASGLTGDAVYVNPVKLSLHFMLALSLLCYLFWFALQWLVPAEQVSVNKPANRLIIITLVVLAIQLFYGAFMAGNKAAAAAPTWPDINGQWIPAYLNKPGEGLLNLVDNKITIHFIHRGLAYVLVLLVILLTIKLFQQKGSALYRKIRFIPLALVCGQVLLGIFSVLSSTGITPGQWGTFEWMAQLHQLTAMCLLLSLVLLLYVARKKSNLTTY